MGKRGPGGSDALGQVSDEPPHPRPAAREAGPAGGATSAGPRTGGGGKPCPGPCPVGRAVTAAAGCREGPRCHPATWLAFSGDGRHAAVWSGVAWLEGGITEARSQSSEPLPAHSARSCQQRSKPGRTNRNQTVPWVSLPCHPFVSAPAPGRWRGWASSLSVTHQAGPQPHLRGKDPPAGRCLCTSERGAPSSERRNPHPHPSPPAPHISTRPVPCPHGASPSPLAPLCTLLHGTSSPPGTTFLLTSPRGAVRTQGGPRGHKPPFGGPPVSRVEPGLRTRV